MNKTSIMTDTETIESVHTVSRFRNSRCTKPNDSNYDISDFIKTIRDGKYEEYVRMYRSETEEEKRQELKNKMPCITVSGTFSYRNNQGLIKHSGLICLDFDNLYDRIYEAKKALREESFVYAVGVSLSGAGLFCIVKIDSKLHKESFESLSEYMQITHGLTADRACKDVSRLRYVTCDEDIYENTEATVWEVQAGYLQKKPNPSNKNLSVIPHVESHFLSVLSRVTSDVTEDYASWVKIAFAFANQFGEAGFDYFHKISKLSSKYKSEEDCLRKYTNACNTQNGQIGIGTFYYIVKQAGIEVWTPEEIDVITLAKQAYERGSDFKDLMQTTPSEALKSHRELAEAVMSDPVPFSKVLDSHDNGKKKFDSNKLASLIKEAMGGKLKQNEITGDLELNGEELDARKRGVVYFQVKDSYNSLKEGDYSLLLDTVVSEPYNPLKEYIEALEWDGIDYIKKMADSLKTRNLDAKWTERFLKKWLIGLIQNVYYNEKAHEEPSCLCLVFVGEQNTGKTHVFHNLLPAGMRRYFAESSLDRDKDSEIDMSRHLVIFDDEFSGKSKQDSKKMKKLTSAKNFTVRKAYGRKSEHLRRLALLCGTCNETQVLNDVTGNRRFMVFDIQSIDHDLINSVDRDGLIAQLKTAYDDGYRSKLEKEDMKAMEIYINEAYREEVTAEELIKRHFLAPSDANSSYEAGMTATEIWDVIDPERRNRIGLRMISLTLKKMGYSQSVQRRNGHMHRLYAITKSNMQ